MYNRYLREMPQQETEKPSAAQNAPQTASVFGDLSRALGSRLQGVRLDMDTILVVALVWFLLSDQDSQPDSDLLIIIGALLLFGL